MVTFSHRNAWILTISSIFAIYGAQLTLISLGVLDVVASVIGDLLVIAALAMSVVRSRVGAKALGLRWPPARFLLAGLLIGLTAWFINLQIVVLIQPPGNTKGLERVVEQTALVPTILAIAVLPAIAEELVFRGVLARTLAVRWSIGAAVLGSSLLFGIYHLVPSQMITTFLLGLALAFLAVRSDSVLPSMIAHVCNNAVAIVISRDDAPDIAAWISLHPATTLAICLVSVASGLALAAKGGV